MKAFNKQTILIGYNTSHYVYLFRRNLIESLQKNGFSVALVSKRDAYTDRLESLGVKHFDCNFNNDLNIFNDINIILRLIKIFYILQPKFYLGYTIKPNIYGLLASFFFKTRVINNITGLGSGFINIDFKTKIIKLLYKISLRLSYKVFFQNPDDKIYFIEQKLVKKNQVGLLPGSGVDLDFFNNFANFNKKYKFPKHEDEYFNVLFIGRLLVEKGILELESAAKLIYQNSKKIRIHVLGSIDETTPKSFLDSMSNNNLIFLGKTDDVRPYIYAADCIVLPSYREGTPRSLLESASLSKPLIATNVPGCKEVVKHNFNGFLCEAKNPEDLYKKLLDISQCSANVLSNFSKNSRSLAEEKFDENLVLDKYLSLIL